MGKSERLMQLELLLLSHPEGMRRAEIARRLGVHRSTVGRYVDELKVKVDIWEDEFVVGVNSDESMDMMKLSVYESLAFHLSAELLANHMEYHNPHMSSGLRKLAENMRKHAPSMSASIDSMAESIETGAKLQDPDYIKVMETMTDSWVSGKIVRIEHLNEKSGKVEETDFAPYFIGFYDQNGARRPISVTGRLRHTSAIQTIDMRKIRSAEILDEIYTIPDNLKPFRKSEYAAPIESEDLVPLKMKIRERSVLNVFQNLYFDHLKIHEPDEGGWMLCDIEAENSIELFLRIVQCGASVEIIGPESYRKKFIRDIEKILALYHT
jgi:predicted DNA-binding transcriptional regulator YafY